MKTKSKFYPFSVACRIAVTLLSASLASYAQVGTYLFTGSESTVTLNPGIYNITAYGAQGCGSLTGGGVGGLGAQMSAQFYFPGVTTITLLVGGGGIVGYSSSGGGAGGGGGGSFVALGSSPLLIAGGGGGSGVNGTSGSPGLIGTSGGSGLGYAAGVGGSNGNGGGGSDGSGGGGFFGNGGSGNSVPLPNYGSSFLNGGGGGAGYQYVGNGGYGGGGGGGPYGGGGGGGYSGGGCGGYFGSVGNICGGGGGGSYIDPSAQMVLAAISGIASPDGSRNGEIIITAVPEPTTLALVGLGATALMARGRRRQK
jgi:hypothetical protein